MKALKNLTIENEDYLTNLQEQVMPTGEFCKLSYSNFYQAIHFFKRHKYDVSKFETILDGYNEVILKELK